MTVSAQDDYLQSIDKSQFSTAPYARRVEKPWGWEIHFVTDDLPYMGKMIHLDEGKRWSLQVHDQKQESWFLADGQIICYFENADGVLEEFEMQRDVGYTAQLGQRHRFKGGKGGGTVFEVSTPEIGTTYRLEDDYNRPNETEELRQYRNENLSDAR